MKKSQLLIILALLALLLVINQLFTPVRFRGYIGGLPWYGWTGISAFLVVCALAFALRDARRERRLLEEPIEKVSDPNDQRIQLSKELLEKYDPAGPAYPHPVIISDRCIGCHACVEACPHDVISMVNNIAVPVASDQCVEDTACQVECPVSPKACIVVNTTKIIKARPVPVRNELFMTNVPGCYLIGDVSGTPLIKNAANEGADVIKHIAREVKTGESGANVDFDVAIIGIGPAGLSAAVVAKKHKLRYVGIEQDKVLGTIEAYPKNKYVFFKPDTMESRGGLAVDGAGEQREKILDSWTSTMTTNGVVINEEESCKAVKRVEADDCFIVETEKGEQKTRLTYRTRRVVLAVGNRGTPLKLGVPGEETKLGGEDKVIYKLSNPESFKRKRIVVVGGGNSAVEAVVDLVARRDGDRIEFRQPGEINEVTLLVRSNFKNDLKFGNKQQIYHCIDEGKVNIFFGVAIKEIREHEVVLMDVSTKKITHTIPNDFVVALIGGDRPTRFLESIGISIPRS